MSTSFTNHPASTGTQQASMCEQWQHSLSVWYHKSPVSPTKSIPWSKEYHATTWISPPWAGSRDFSSLGESRRPTFITSTRGLIMIQVRLSYLMPIVPFPDTNGWRRQSSLGNRRSRWNKAVDIEYATARRGWEGRSTSRCDFCARVLKWQFLGLI